jgi:hypothetical protein
MPKSSANVPESQPSINRLSLTAQSVRDVGSPSGDQTGFCCGLLCFDAEAQGSAGWGGPMCICADAEASSMASLLFSCFEDFSN